MVILQIVSLTTAMQLQKGRKNCCQQNYNLLIIKKHSRQDKYIVHRHINKTDKT